MDPIKNVIMPETKSEGELNKISDDQPIHLELVEGALPENASDNEDEIIMISVERLKKLELLEKSLPEMIENAIQGYKKNKLTMLHEKDKLNPAAVNLRVKRYNERHKEEINARRKAKRNEGKNYVAKPQSNSIVDSLSVPKQPDVPVLKSIVTSTSKEFTIRF